MELAPDVGPELLEHLRNRVGGALFEKFGRVLAPGAAVGIVEIRNRDGGCVAAPFGIIEAVRAGVGGGDKDSRDSVAHATGHRTVAAAEVTRIFVKQGGEDSLG